MKPSDKKYNLYEVPLSIVLFFLIIYFITSNSLFVKIGFVLGLLPLLSKRLARIITQAWQRLMAAIGFVNAHVLLTLIFFIVLVPISFLYRLRKKDPLKLKKGGDSYFQERNHQYEAKDLENPW